MPAHDDRPPSSNRRPPIETAEGCVIASFYTDRLRELNGVWQATPPSHFLKVAGIWGQIGCITH